MDMMAKPGTGEDYLEEYRTGLCPVVDIIMMMMMLVQDFSTS